MKEQEKKNLQFSGAGASLSAKKRRVSTKGEQHVLALLLQGESIEFLSRENNLTATAMYDWWHRFLQDGIASLKALKKQANLPSEGLKKLLNVTNRTQLKLKKKKLKQVLQTKLNKNLFAEILIGVSRAQKVISAGGDWKEEFVRFLVVPITNHKAPRY